MPTNEVKQVDNWDEEVTDIAPKQVSSWDEEVVDEPVKKKDTTPLPLESKSPKSALDVLSGVNPSAKALLTEQKKDGTTQSKPTAKLDLTAENKKFGDLKVGQEETDKPLFGITKESKAKINEVYNLSKQKESLIDDYARNSMALNAIAKNTAVTDLNNLYLQKQQAIKSGNNQLVANINARIEATRSLPVSQPLDLQSQIRANAEKYSNQPQDFNRPEIPMNPITENQTLERNGFKVAATIGDLHDRYTEASATMQKIQPELERIDSTITDFKKENRVGNYDKYEGDGNVLEGALDVPEAFGRGFGSTAKSIYQGLATVLGDKQDRIDQANRRYVEESILYPTQTKGMLTSGAEMMGGVAPYVVSTAVAPESVLAHVVVNGLSMGASGIGNGYYEMYQKQKQQGATDEQADEFAVKNAKFEGIKETAVGAMLPFMGGIGAKTFLAPAEKSAMKEFLATQGVIIPTFTASKLASNVFQKYGLDQEDVNIGDGLQETVENAIILGGMMEFAHKAPKALKEAYRVNLSGQYPSLEGVINKAVQDGVLDASRAQIFTEKLKKDYVVFNSMPKDITTEQKLAIEPEVKAIIELSKQEPSAIENPEVAKDKIAQLQKVVAEKLGTPLTEKETKSYEKLLGRKKPIESASGEKIVLELLPSEKVELEHYEKRIEKAKENEAKLAKEEEKPVVEQESPIEETKDSGLEEETPSVLSNVKSTAKALESKKEEELNKILPERERLSHRIVKDEYTTTADDMTKGGNLIPNDFYQHPEYYADLSDPNYKESWDAIKKIKGNPDAEITIYRSAPNGSAIEEGDWISLSKKYAKQEGEHPTDESQDLPVISMKVKAKEIVWDGNDINEFAYYPEKSESKADKISKAYHKAKVDGSNPELVKAVESILSKETPTTETKIAEEAPKAEPIAPKENIFEIHEKTKGAPKKDKVIEQYAKENPKQIDRVREIIDNFDTLKQEFIKQIEQKEIRNFKIEC